VHRPIAFVVFLFLAVVAVAGRTGSVSEPHVLVVGLYAMDNRQVDMHNPKVDDVMSETRQKEIVEVDAVLAKFHPTKIAIEAPFDDPKTQQQYDDYRTGKYLLTRNEMDQIGFRLAKQLGHAKIYPIDIKGDFPFEAVAQLAADTGQQSALDELVAQGKNTVDAMEAELKNRSVMDTLRLLNSPEEVAKDQSLYMKFARFATQNNYAGPDLLAAWYRRNARIYANLRNIISSPDDRILVLYGAGHLYWFQRNILDAHDLVLDRLQDYQ
jgi:Family of unknown function (DUF5694)